MEPPAFREAAGRFASGVTVVTARLPDGADLGITVSAFCSLSLEPPLVVVSIAHERAIHAALVAGGGFAVNILAADQAELSD